MEDITGELSNVLQDAFGATEYARLVTLPDNFWVVMYSGKFGVDYCFRGLLGLCKSIQKAGVDMKPDVLFNELAANSVDRLTGIATMSYEHNNINFVLKPAYVKQKLGLVLAGDIVSQVQGEHVLNILVDFSSPNVAKDMHVGHLRSTIIGDIICRYFEAQGHNVRRVNHIGDFGLPFGMIIQYMYEECPNFMDMRNVLTISNLQEFYAKSKARYDASAEFNKLAHQRVVQLQDGDPEIARAWNFIKDISRDAYNQIYRRLNIQLEEVGESFYQNMIPEVVQRLRDVGLLVENDGRQIIQVPGYEVPLTVVKSDGGYTYDTTDLAAIWYRLVHLNTDRVYYVVGTAQAEHFELIFEAAKLAGWIKPHQQVHHIGFGLIMGEDGKPFKSRNGDTVKLVDLLDDGLDSARQVVESKPHNLTKEELDVVVRSVAYSAIKYYDLSSNRLKNYKFSYDDMLSTKGNTSVYNLYALVRMNSIMRNVKDFVGDINDVLDINKVTIEHESERDLAIQLIQFAEVFNRVGKEFYIHGLCDYIYKLSTVFHVFFTNCRCIFYQQDGKKIESVNESRLALCFMTSKVMTKCFELLNIQPLERM